MKHLTAYSFRAERVALTLGAVRAALVVVHLLAMQVVRIEVGSADSEA